MFSDHKWEPDLDPIDEHSELHFDEDGDVLYEDDPDELDTEYEQSLKISGKPKVSTDESYEAAKKLLEKIVKEESGLEYLTEDERLDLEFEQEMSDIEATAPKFLLEDKTEQVQKMDSQRSRMSQRIQQSQSQHLQQVQNNNQGQTFGTGKDMRELRKKEEKEKKKRGGFSLFGK